MSTLRRSHRFGIAALSIVVVGFAFVALYRIVRAADGSGTNVVTPSTVAAGTTGNTHTFTFTAAEAMSSGEVALTVPSGWTMPQAVSGTAGYTTVVATGGMLANVEDAADSTTGWAAGSACTGGLVADTGTKHEGAASIRCTNGNEGNNDRWYRNLATENWSAYTNVGFWIHSSAAIASGDLRFAYDNNTNIASPIEQISFGSEIPANTWTYVVLPFGAAARTSVVSYGFIIRSPKALDNVTVRVDDILLGPGAATFPGGGDVRVRLLQLPAGATVAFAYGANGGASGVTAPTALGPTTFTTRTRVSDAGTLAAIATSPVVTVAPGPLSRFILNDPGGMVAGARVGYVVERKDQYGNPITSGAATVYLYSDSTGNHGFYSTATSEDLLTSVAFVNGSSTANFWYEGEQSGLATIAVSDNSSAPDGLVGVDDATDGVTVTAASASQFLLNDPGSMTAGERLGYVVTRRDQFGNLATSGSNVVYVHSDSSGNKAFYTEASGGAPVTSVTIAEGATSAAFWYYDEKAGTASIAVSDNPAAPDGASGLNDGLDTVVVAAAPVARLLLNNPGDMTLATRLEYAVTRVDQFGNFVTSGPMSVYLYSNSSGASKTFYDAATLGNTITSVTIEDAASSKNFWYYDEEPGSWTVTVSDNATAPDAEVGVADANDNVVVTEIPIVPTRFLLLDPTDAVAGENVMVTVRVLDDAGSVDTSFQNDVTLTLTGAATGAGLIDIVDGIGTKTISNAVAETVTLALQDTQSTGLLSDSSQDVVFSAGPTHHFDLTDPGVATAGVRLPYVVTRKDQLENTTTSGGLTVYLYASSGTARFYDAPAGGSQITSATFMDGVSTSSFWYEDTTAGSDVVTVSDNALAADGAAGIADVTDTVDVLSGALSKFMVNDPGDMMVGTRIGYTMSREDAFGNAVTIGDTTAYLTATPVGTSASFYDAAAGGSQITSLVIAAGQSTGAFWYYDEGEGSRIITVSDNASGPDGAAGVADAADTVAVSAAPIVATRFAILDPEDVVVGGNMTVVVRAEDASGNVDTSYQTDVRLNADGSATGDGVIDVVNGVGTATLTSAVAETVTLTLTDVESTGLNVSSMQQAVFRAVGEEASVSYGGSGSASPLPAQTILRFVGRAYPGARLALNGKNEKTNLVLSEAVVSSADGSFQLEYAGPFEEIASYEVSVTDKQGQVSPSIPFTDEVELNAVTERIIFPAPTINLSRASILRGNQILVFGYGTPGYHVEVVIDDEAFQKVIVEEDGTYKLLLPTLQLEYGKHAIRTRQVAADGVKSGDSVPKTLNVSRVLNARTDLNEDTKVDIADWSIFLYRWRSADESLRALLDMNSDGEVDVSDFSIFIRTIRK
ncbi:MAG: dockerin type I domain-containing protein [Patescibacteria group bacterium]|jgi:hypothetical protein